jgi:trk system potassium uptake protein TrkH
MQLFKAEVPGPTADKLTPRIQETAKRLWLIYVGLSVFQMILLMPVSTSSASGTSGASSSGT